MKYLLSTRNRENYATTVAQNCTIPFEKKLSVGEYRLTSLILPFYDYNVTENNNRIYFNDGTDDLVAVLTPGTYTSLTIAAEVKARMDAVSAQTFTVSVDDTTNKLTVAIGADTVQFTFGTNSASSANKLLGFIKTDGTAAASVTSDHPVQLRRAEYLQLNVGGSDIVNASGTGRFSLIVPIDDHDTTVYLYGASVPQQRISLTGDQVNEIKVELRYPDNTLVDTRGYDFSMLIEPVCEA